MKKNARTSARTEAPATAKATVRRRHRGVTTDMDILDSAERLFAKYGYDSVSTKQLAAETGVTIGALYHHFPSKEALYNAVTERAFAKHSILPDDLFAADDSKEKKLSRLIAWFIANLAADETFGQLLQRELLDARAVNGDGLIRKYFSKPTTRFKTLLGELLPNANLDAAFATTLALCIGFANLKGVYIMAPGAQQLLDSPDNIADYATRLLLGGLH